MPENQTARGPYLAVQAAQTHGGTRADGKAVTLIQGCGGWPL